MSLADDLAATVGALDQTYWLKAYRGTITSQNADYSVTIEPLDPLMPTLTNVTWCSPLHVMVAPSSSCLFALDDVGEAKLLTVSGVSAGFPAGVDLDTIVNTINSLIASVNSLLTPAALASVVCAGSGSPPTGTLVAPAAVPAVIT